MTTAINDGGPAFPVQDASKWQAHGMTLRDYFAAKALQSMAFGVMGPAVEQRMGGEAIAAMVARSAYDFADAMLKARQA